MRDLIYESRTDSGCTATVLRTDGQVTAEIGGFFGPWSCNNAGITITPGDDDQPIHVLHLVDHDNNEMTIQLAYHELAMLHTALDEYLTATDHTDDGRWSVREYWQDDSEHFIDETEIALALAAMEDDE